MDPGLARVYAAEAHPPFVPFAIRYMFAPAPPCVPHDFVSRTSIQTRSTFAPASLHQSDPIKFPDVVDHLWENVTSEADVRTIYISAHINSNYGFDEFQCATLTPFDISIEQRKKSSDPSTALLTAIMPNLQQKNPAIFSEIQNMEKELEDTIAGSSYRTEKRCICCKRDWGPRSEELGRAYLLRKLECEKHSLIRTQQQKDFERTLKLVPSMLKRSLLEDTEVVDHGDMAGYTTKPPYHELSSCLDRICQLLFCMHTDFLLQKRADRLVSEKERILYVSYERYVDETYSDIGKCLQIINLSSTNAQKWRNRGVYENARCSDWVLKDLASPGEHCTYKPEPNYLQRFGLMDHNPGRFNIGRQDDQNHGFDSFIGRQPPHHTDIFRNNPCAGFLCAVSMIGNPMSLVGHGVYDRMKKPGSIIRCPSLPREVYFRSHLLDRDKTELLQRAASLIEIWTSLAPLLGWRQRRRYCTSQVYFGWKTINFEINEQDPDGFSLVALGPKRFQVNHLTSMAHLICNIPLPGQGRFHLSSPKGHVDEYSTSISVLYTR